MKKILVIFVLSLLLSLSAHAKDGFGPVKFSTQNYNAFIAYLTGDYKSQDHSGMLKNTGGNPDGFAINQAGTVAYFFYCPKGAECMATGTIDAQNACTKRSKKQGGERCFVFAKRRVIVWDSTYIKIPRKVTKDQVKEIFAKYGWYGEIEN